MLAMPSFSSAFNTIDHSFLVHRLHTDFGFADAVLQWFSTYVTDCTHYVSLSNHCSVVPPMRSGFPQGSVLGPEILSIFIKPLSTLIDSHSITHHSSAVDPLLQMSSPPDKCPSYFILCSHVYAMSMIGELRTRLSLMTTTHSQC